MKVDFHWRRITSALVPRQARSTWVVRPCLRQTGSTRVDAVTYDPVACRDKWRNQVKFLNWMPQFAKHSCLSIHIFRLDARLRWDTVDARDHGPLHPLSAGYCPVAQVVGCREVSVNQSAPTLLRRNTRGRETLKPTHSLLLSFHTVACTCPWANSSILMKSRGPTS